MLACQRRRAPGTPDQGAPPERLRALLVVIRYAA